MTVTGGSFPSGKNAVDNGLAANSTSHQAVAAGLDVNTVFSCVVTSGGTSSSPQNQTTAVAHSTTPITIAFFGAATATSPDGDILYNFLSNDNLTYMTRDDANTPGTNANQQIDKITNESTLAISQVNALTAYGAFNTTNGTDGPGGIALSNKFNGLFGMAGSLFGFTGRHQITSGPVVRKQYYGNVIRSDNHGASWSNFNNPTTFNANGIPAFPNSGGNSVAPFFFGANSNFGWVTPVRYAADDGTLGYNTPGNGFDGGNAYCYFAILDGNNDSADYAYLGRIPRISLFALDYTAEQFWIGPTSPTAADFVNDANWQSASTGLTQIYAAAGKVGWPDICFIPTINRYLLFTSYRPDTSVTGNTVWQVLEGPTPAGPWTLIGLKTNTTTGYYAQTILHRTACTNVLTDGIALTVIYSGDFQNASMYHPTYSTLTLSTQPQNPVTNLFVQAKGSTTALTGTNPTFAYNSNVTSGDLLVAVLRYNSSGVPRLSSVTSNRTTGNWTVVYDQNDGGGTPIQEAWAYAWATSTGACTVTFNFGASIIGFDVCLCEWSGPTAFRVNAGLKNTTQSTNIVGNTLSCYAGDLLIGVIGLGSAANNTFTAASGYVLRAQGKNGAVNFCAVQDKLTAALQFATAQFVSNFTDGSVRAILDLAAFYSQGIISGNVGVAGATVAWTSVSSGSGSTTSDGSGNYSTSSLASDVYTLTPTKTGYSFSPTSVQQVMVSANLTGVNFTATHLPVSTPSISPNGGNFDSPQTVTVSDTDSGLAGFAMYYTTDGTTPTTGSTLYTAPIAVSTSLTLKVLAVATGFLNSAVASATFNVVRGGGGLGYRFTYGF
jgi:hypothetical protein